MRNHASRALTAAACAVAVAAVIAPQAHATTVVGATTGSLTVSAGQPLTFVHQTSGGLGLGWTLAHHTNRRALRLVRVTSVSDDPDPQAVGGPSTKRFVFRARHGGWATLTFIRDFRGEDRHYVMRVHVI